MKNDYSHIYSLEVLKYWHSRYTPNILWNFESLIAKKLSRTERENAYAVNLIFPLTPDPEFSSTPFSFYADIKNKNIYIPISSVKFIDDLSIAYAWLSENNYSIETVIDYVFCLKYGPGRFVDGKIPTPLMALHIPDDALQNKMVDHVSQNVIKSIIVWILSHELAHIIYQHPSYASTSFSQSQHFEADADSFATNMFKRIGTVPAGMVLLFTTFASFFLHRGDFYSEEEWQKYLQTSTHPTSYDRLASIANELISCPQKFIDAEPNKIKARQIAEYIGMESKRIAETISSSQMQEFMRARALSLDVSSLLPRKGGEIPIYDQKYTEYIFDDSEFSGLYFGIYIHKLASGDDERLNATFLFFRNKEKVNGRFSFGVGLGSLTGYIENNQLKYNWVWGDARGKGIISMKQKNIFFGEWGYEDKYNGGGSIEGEKKIP